MNSTIKKNNGVTLIELLVVVAILSVLTAIMIPRLRVINKDRNIREAARVVGSVFANASLRAVTDGTAGVIIERNLNLVDGEDVNFGATTLYLLRKVPVYAGDDFNATANRDNDYQLTIDKPLEQDEQGVMLENDYISVNYSSVKYRIINVNPVGMKLTLILSSGEGGPVLPPLPNSSSGLPFVVHRQPRKLESSRVELPEGYLVDMRFSGPINPNPYTSAIVGSPRCWFHEIINPLFADQDLARTTQVIFNGTGGIDRIYFYNPDTSSNPGGFVDSKIPIGSLYLFVTEYEVDPLPNYGILESPSSLWVTVNNTTGSTSVGYNVPAIGATLGERIKNARGIAQQRQSAAQ